MSKIDLIIDHFTRCAFGRELVGANRKHHFEELKNSLSVELLKVEKIREILSEFVLFEYDDVIHHEGGESEPISVPVNLKDYLMSHLNEWDKKGEVLFVLAQAIIAHLQEKLK